MSEELKKQETVPSATENEDGFSYEKDAALDRLKKYLSLMDKQDLTAEQLNDFGEIGRLFPDEALQMQTAHLEKSEEIKTIHETNLESEFSSWPYLDSSISLDILNGNPILTLELADAGWVVSDVVPTFAIDPDELASGNTNSLDIPKQVIMDNVSDGSEVKVVVVNNSQMPDIDQYSILIRPQT